MTARKPDCFYQDTQPRNSITIVGLTWIFYEYCKTNFEVPENRTMMIQRPKISRKPISLQVYKTYRALKKPKYENIDLLTMTCNWLKLASLLDDWKIVNVTPVIKEKSTGDPGN